MSTRTNLLYKLQAILEDLKHGSATPSIGRGDARSDLGYGRLSNTNHNLRQHNKLYPYNDSDSFDDPEWDSSDIEYLDAIDQKVNIAQPANDPETLRGIPMYFVGGNTKLSDCYWRLNVKLWDCVVNPELFINEVDIIENSVMSNSIVPIPGIWRNAVKSGGMGATTYLTVKHPKRTGTKKGWSLAPDKHEDAINHEEYTNIEDGQFLTIWDIIDKNNVK